MCKKTVLGLFLIGGMLMTAAFFGGCGRSAEKSDEVSIEKEVILSDAQQTLDKREEQKSSAPEATETGLANEKDKSIATNMPQSPGQAPEQIPSKILKTADISIQVEHYADSRKAILSMVKRHKAMVSGENQTNDGYRITNTMTIRVDAASFDSLVEDLMTEAIYVERKIISAQDVTEEYVDLTARMKSKKEVEAQYSEILKKARTINEILEVTEYLRAIREEIESVEGRLKYLDNRVAYSTISLSFYEQLDVVSKQPDRTFGSRLGEAFGWGWNGLVAFFLGLIYVWPLWVILGATAWLIVWLVKRAKRRNQANKDS